MDASRFLTHSLQDPRLLRILAAALDAVEPSRLVWDYLQKVDLPNHDRLFLLGIGKASEVMTRAAAEFFKTFAGGLVITKQASSPRVLDRITVMEGSHPIPDERSLVAGKAVLDFVSNLHENDLLICLISGGASALVTAPRPGVTLEEIRSKTASLLAGGATIHEINKFRRQLDQLKGGGLARSTNAKIVSLILSDVIGNSLETIASGLTVDPSLGPRTQNIIIGDLRFAALSAQRQAITEGFSAEILDLQIQGEAKEVGLQLASKLKEERRKRTKPFCLIAGGETTVTIKGDGKGGRNQELALAAAGVLNGLEKGLLISLATDGDDGPTDAAGAVANGQSYRRAKELGMEASDYLSRNDAYRFFDPLGDLIKCGYSGTNVNDLMFLIGL